MLIVSANRQYRLSKRPHSHIARDEFWQLPFSDKRLLFAKAVTLLVEKWWDRICYPKPEYKFFRFV